MWSGRERGLAVLVCVRDRRRRLMSRRWKCADHVTLFLWARPDSVQSKGDPETFEAKGLRKMRSCRESWKNRWVLSRYIWCQWGITGPLVHDFPTEMLIRAEASFALVYPTSGFLFIKHSVFLFCFTLVLYIMTSRREVRCDICLYKERANSGTWVWLVASYRLYFQGPCLKTDSTSGSQRKASLRRHNMP